MPLPHFLWLFRLPRDITKLDTARTCIQQALLFHVVPDTAVLYTK